MQRGGQRQKHETDQKQPGPHTLKEFPTVSCLFPFLRRVVGVPPAGSEIYRHIEDDCGYQSSDKETRRCPTNDTRRAFNRV